MRRGNLPRPVGCVVSLGDEEHPISFQFEYETRGEHTHVQVRAGQRGMRAVAGRLVLRRVEWSLLKELLRRNNALCAEPLDLMDSLGGWLDEHPIDALPVEGMVDS